MWTHWLSWIKCQKKEWEEHCALFLIVEADVFHQTLFLSLSFKPIITITMISKTSTPKMNELLCFLCVCVLVARSCPTLCDPTNCRPPGFSVHGILQARTLEWIAIPFSRGSSWPRDRTLVSCIAGRLFTVWATGKSLHFLNVFKMSSSTSFWSRRINVGGLSPLVSF